MATNLPFTDLESPINLQDDMALNEVEKAWIRGEIAASHKRSGLGYATGFLKDWGGLLGIGGLIIFVITQWGTYIEFRTKTNDRLTLIGKSLEKIDPSFSATELTQINHVDNVTIRRAQEIVQSAKNDHRVIDPQIVAATGKKFVEASGENPAAWGAALDLLEYKTFLNGTSSLVPHPPPDNFVTLYGLHVPDGKSTPVQTVSGVAPPNSEALLNNIGVNMNPSMGNAIIFLKGGAITIDGTQFRNVVLSNVEVYYDGGPVQMENVYFVNCIFHMSANKNTQNLTIAALDQGPSMNFSGL